MSWVYIHLLQSSAMPDDFMPPDPFMVVFPSGTSGNTSVYINITIFEDEVLECDHDFTVAFDSTNPMVNVMVGSPSSVTVTIREDSADCK